MPAPLEELSTVRDWFRYAVTLLNRAEVAFGHGTGNAVDEAAFLILSALDLPIDDLSPWLDARLTRDERQRIASLIEARIATRKPAAYLLNRAYIQGRRFYCDERTIVPRSFIGELLVSDSLAAIVPDADTVTSVLDLCTGSGCLAILAAEAYPNARIAASDASADALAVARRNVADYRLEDRITILHSDLFAALPSARYDLIISNPPYVTAAAVAAFPPEHRAEPEMAHLGGADGLDLVRRILASAPDWLTPDGSLIVEVGTGRDSVEASYPDLPFLWLDTETSTAEVFALHAGDFAGARQRQKKKRR